MKAEQQSLFDLTPAPWELDDAAEQLAASVVFTTGPSQMFDYLVPEVLRGQVAAGQRVRAPFGRGDRLATGYCVCVENRPVGSRRLKPLDSLVDRQPLLSAAMLRLAAWMVDYYLCTWAQVLEALVPAGVRFQAGTRQTQVVSLPNDAADRLHGQKLTSTQRKIIEALRVAGGPLPIARLARCRWVHGRADSHAAKERPVGADLRASRRFGGGRANRYGP